VYSTKADALLKQATDFTDLRLAPLQNIKDIFTGKWSGLLSDSTSVGFVFGAYVLPIASIAMGVYILCKARSV
jgi:hypothetical protein